MPAILDPSNLRRVALFGGMSLPELAVLNGLMRRHTLPAGSRIVMTEQLEDTAYIIQTGVVKMVVEQSDGGELISSILGPGDVIWADTISESSGGAYSILPLDETNLFWIDRLEFERCIRAMPALNVNLSAVLAHQVRLGQDRIEALAGLDVRSRLVRHLLLLAREYGEPATDSAVGCVRIPLRLTQSDLAHLVGASRVRVNHALSELRRRQVVETNGDRQLWIRDLAALEKLR